MIPPALDIEACSHLYQRGVALIAGKLAERATPDAVRYYERAGLLPPAERTTSGYRSYSEADVERLQFVKGAQRVGLRLREVRELLEVMDRGMCPCEHTESLIRERIAEIDRELGRLRDLRGRLASIVARLLSSANSAAVAATATGRVSGAARLSSRSKPGREGALRGRIGRSSSGPRSGPR